MAGGEAIPPDYYRIILVRRGALRLLEGAKETTLLPRGVALALPEADCRMIPGPGSETERRLRLAEFLMLIYPSRPRSTARECLSACAISAG
jgi:hypothetical protein